MKTGHSCMAKTTRPRARMDRYCKHLQRNSYILSYNKKGSYITKNKKWDLIKRLTKKLHSEDELPGIKVPEEARCSDSAVKFLPRQDVMLYGMIPAREQRLYSTCRNCSRVFNPLDTLTHRNCTKSHAPHSGLLKKKVKSKNGNSKSLSSNGSPSSHSSNSTSPVLPSPSSLLKEPVKDFEFKRPYTPPLKKVRKPIRQSKTFLYTTKTSKSGSVTTSGSTRHLTTSSDKSDSKVSSKMSSSHHNPSSSSSRHHSSKSSPSHNSDDVFRSGKLAVTVVATSVKSTPMDTLPPSSSSHHYHHHRSSSSSSRHRKSSSDSSKRSSSSSSSSNSAGSTSSSSSSSSSSSKSLPKDYDAELHCGSSEHSRSTGVRSVTSSNHRLQLRKQVSGRSKDIHQMSPEKKAAKENDMKHTTPTCSYSSPNGEAKDILAANITYVPIAGQLVSTNASDTNSFVHLVPKFSNHQSRHSTTSVLSKLLEIGNNIMSLESPQSASNPPIRKRMVLPVSSTHTRAIRMYKSHPKPTVFPNFGARRLGGAILLSNPLIEDQRNDLLSVINGNSKGIVPDVNGFILHADVSQAVEAQKFSVENSSSQHKFIISLIKKHNF
uniref:SCA7 domain-containing protein n=1 Tax=Dendroctonus ponderosae TaxID=77166 RepID=A0AAR5PHF0_DENPD